MISPITEEPMEAAESDEETDDSRTLLFRPRSPTPTATS
jgi:hypothetical protein